MALAPEERARIRRLALWLALVGVVIGVLAYFGVRGAQTFLANREVAPSQGVLLATVYNDANADGQIDVLDPAEGTVAGVSLVLRVGQETIELMTDEAGAATRQLPVGTYAVSATFAGEAISIAPEQLTIRPGATSEVQLRANSAGQTLSHIYGFVFTDLDKDGQVSLLDAPRAGATVILRPTGESEVARVETDQDGAYRFDELTQGSYDVAVIDPEQNEVSVQSVEIASLLVSRRVDFLLVQQVRAAAEARLAQAIVASRPGIEIQKLASDADEAPQEYVSARPGSLVSYDITLSALGTGTTYANVRVEDEVPAGLTPKNISNGGTLSNGVISWTIGTMSGGDELTLTYGATVSSGADDGQYRNVATLRTDGMEPVQDDSYVIVSSGPVRTVNETPNGTGTTNNTTGTGGTTNDTRGDSAPGTPAVGTGTIVAAVAAIPAVLIALILAKGLRRANN